MKYISTKRMQAIDRVAIERYGVPSLILMENAGRGIANLAEGMMGNKDVIPARFRRESRSPTKDFGDDRHHNVKILVVCGKGNNGGDGFVAARHLINRGFRVQAVSLAKPSEFKDDPKTNYLILKKMGTRVKHFTSGRRLKLQLRSADLIIDAIFGIGLSRPVSGIYLDAICAINDSGKPVLAVDIPSGINSDTGKVMGAAVRAKMTGTLAARKCGLGSPEGRKYAGIIKVLDISIPRNLLK